MYTLTWDEAGAAADYARCVTQAQIMKRTLQTTLLWVMYEELVPKMTVLGRMARQQLER